MQDLEYILKDPRWTRGGQAEDGHVRKELPQDTEFFVVRSSACLESIHCLSDSDGYT